MKLLMLCVSTIVILLPNSALGNSRPADICKRPTHQYGLIPPILPLNMYLWSEVVDGNFNSIATMHMAVDADHNRMATETHEDGHYYKFLIDYRENSAITLIRERAVEDKESLGYGYQCKVRNTMDLVYLQTGFGKSVKRLQEQLLYYNRYFDYSRTNNCRGTTANYFKGCINFDQLPAAHMSLNVSYAFASDDVFPPSGFMNAPLQMHVNGLETDLDDNHTSTYSQVKSFYYFDSMKPKYAGIFQIPEGVYCDGLHYSKPFPLIETEELITGVEVVKTTYQYGFMGDPVKSSVTSNQREYLSKHLQLERIDFTADASFLKGAYKNIPITVVHDLKTDSSFIINKVTSICKFYDHDVLKESGASKYKFTDNVLFNNQNYSKYWYKGDEPCGDALCDVWITERLNSVSIDGASPVTSWTEIKFLRSPWLKQSDVGKQTNVPMQVVTYFNETKGVITLKNKTSLWLYDYEDRHVHLMDFKLDNCLVDDERTYYTLTLSVEATEEDETEVEDEDRMFEEAIIKKMAEIGNIKVLRIQNLYLVGSNTGKVEVIFSITSTYRGAKEEVSGTEAQLALIDIRAAVDEGKFIIKVDAPRFSMELTAVKGSVRKLLPTAESHGSNFFFENKLVTLPDAFTSPASLKQQNAPSNGKYGKGPLAACIVVMLLVGLVFGCLVTLLYFRKFYYHADSNDYETKSFAMEDFKSSDA